MVTKEEASEIIKELSDLEKSLYKVQGVCSRLRDDVDRRVMNTRKRDNVDRNFLICMVGVCEDLIHIQRELKDKRDSYHFLTAS